MNNTVEVENERLRQIRLHERVNDLPDPNYSTLKYFLGHLHRYAVSISGTKSTSGDINAFLFRINQHAASNSMSMQNLAIVFGPTLFSQQLPTNGMDAGGAIADAPYQNQVRPSFPLPFVFRKSMIFIISLSFPLQAIETILNHYTDIFIDESEAEGQS